MTYSPDVNCDVCGEGIVGPVYFRGDVMACRTCAHQINRFGDWPTYYYPMILWPVASALGLVVLFVEMIPILTLLVGAVAVLAFMIGALKALR